MERNAKDREKEKTKRDTQKRDQPKNETSIYILPFTDTVNKIFFFQSRQIGNRTKVFLVSFFRLNFLTLSFISVGSTEIKVNRKISSYLTIPRGRFFLKSSTLVHFQDNRNLPMHKLDITRNMNQERHKFVLSFSLSLSKLKGTMVPQ
jgi:hypothetical protein